MQFITMIIYVLCSVSGLVLFKLGNTEALTLEATPSFFSLKISWLSILGLILYIIRISMNITENGLCRLS